MDRRRLALAALYAAPGVALGLAGLLHPHSLSFPTSQRWWLLHLAGMFVFPLVGVALILLVRHRRDPVAWVVRAGAFVYAVAYTALDVVSGMAAGYVTYRLGPEQLRPPEVSYLFEIGGPTGMVGSYALLMTAVIVLVDAFLREGARAAPALLMLPGAWMVHVDHIFSPVGAGGMALVGLATGYLAWTRWAVRSTA